MVMYTAILEAVSDQLRMTRPQLAGEGRGLELWRLLVREHDTPEQPLIQREYQKRWAYPARCKDAKELAERLPALRTLVLTNNSLRNLADLDGMGACPRLTMLSLVGNPVALKENYRLYVIYKCKHLKTLDFQRVKPAERELAEKTFGADDGAAARAKTFTPGDGLEDKAEKEEEKAAPSGPTPEQLMALKVAIANAETLDEVARLENALKTGVVPKDLEI